MIKQAPSIGRILTMVAFALSCFGILIFLWLNFGGSVPLQPKGYRVVVAFPEATQLAQEAEIRISGVKVGKVRKKEPNEQTGLTDTTLEIDSRFAPIPRNTRAILRQKTLLGETYVELTPGSGDRMVPDGGRLPPGRVSETVELDEILRTFDPETRQRFSIWMDQQGLAVRGQAEAINDALANLAPFAEQTDDVLVVLDTQSEATKAFIRDTGVVFEALSERQGQLRELIQNSNRVWEAVASRDEALADTFRVLPTFLREGRITTERTTQFARTTDPLIDQLRPAARQLSPLLIDLDGLAPDLNRFFQDLGPLVRVSRRGLPATEQVLDNTRPILARLDPFLRQLTPIVDYLGLYKREIAAFFANDSAATQATEVGFGNSNILHYLRTANPVNPEIMTGWPYRLSTNRSNPYTEPNAYNRLKQRRPLPVFGGYLCTANEVAGPPEPVDPYMPADLVAQINTFVYGSPNNVGRAPRCEAQNPLGRLAGQTGRVFPQLQPLP
jgi:phospholipid/cholesterol/gamma-HCH transport system substrate-binding protein